MTIIEDAVRRLEQARAANRKAEHESLGKVIELPESGSGADEPAAAVESPPSAVNGMTGAEASSPEPAAGR